MEPEWTRAGLVGHPAVAVNHVESVRPACVGTFSGVVEIVHDGWELNSEFYHAQLPDLAAFLETFRLREHNFITQVIGVLPHVAGVCFSNIYDVEGHLILVLLG